MSETYRKKNVPGVSIFVGTKIGGQMYIVCAGTIDLLQMQIPFEE